MATCNECHKQVRGELHANMETAPAIAADVTAGGGLIVVDVGIELHCPNDDGLLAYRCMEIEELFDHPCHTEQYVVKAAKARATDQEIIRPDRRSSRRWLGADVTISLECPRCRGEIKLAVTVGDYALAFLTAA